MPELPEVETIRRGLEPHLTGAQIQRVEIRRGDLRIPLAADFAKTLQARRVEGLTRRAKYLLIHLDKNIILVIHLGMSGSLRLLEKRGKSPSRNGASEHAQEWAAPGKHDHILFHLQVSSNAKERAAYLVYNDPRRFGQMFITTEEALATHPGFVKLGIEPLGNRFNGAFLAGSLKDKQTSIKAALLDQRLIAGLGNIYICESLFQADILPFRTASHIAAGEAEKLAASIQDVLTKAIESGGSSLRNYVQSDGKMGYFQHRFHVYDREGQNCLRPGCGAAILRKLQNGRSSFYCPHCQR